MSYLTLDELAAELSLTPTKVRKLMSNEPWCLPPPCPTPLLPMLRWRKSDVQMWLFEAGLREDNVLELSGTQA